jgi:hypothetical protein
MNLATDDEAFQEFLLKDSTFMAVLGDGRLVMVFAANWSKRIEEMLKFEIARRIQKQIELARGKIQNIIVLFYSNGKLYSTAKWHQDWSENCCDTWFWNKKGIPVSG